MKLIFSEFLISRITGIFYGWHGNYKSWEIAKSKCNGYEEKNILEKVITNSLKVKNGEIPYERDSVPFNKKIYSFPVLAALMWIASQRNNKLNVLDFGGSLGTSYYLNSFFLNSLSEVNWCIVEQSHFIEAGNKYFADDKLHFFDSISDCTKNYNIDVIILSGVIQYLEKPYELLEEVISRNFEHIIIDRTLFSEQNEDRLAIQKVPAKIYRASYCCWIFSQSKMMSTLLQKYEQIYDFDIRENINIPALYKGYFFKRIIR